MKQLCIIIQQIEQQYLFSSSNPLVYDLLPLALKLFYYFKEVKNGFIKLVFSIDNINHQIKIYAIDLRKSIYKNLRL
jgi:hypothetical protein